MCDAGTVRLVTWSAIALIALASAPLVFVVMARAEVEEPQPEGTVCDFEHDPGSGKSAEGRIEHRGWLIRRQACVHATDGENVQPIGMAPFLGAIVAPVPTAGVLIALALWWERSRQTART